MTSHNQSDALNRAARLHLYGLVAHLTIFLTLPPLEGASSAWHVGFDGDQGLAPFKL